MGEHGLLVDVIIFLAAGVVAVPIFTKLGLGSVLGYLAAGAVIGPWGLGVISSVDNVLHFSELGVVLLLFVIGLELNPARLWSMRKAVFGLGSAQVLVTGAALAAAAHLAGIGWPAAWVAGFGLALSSTAFALQILGEQGDLYSRYGRTAFAVLLFQDLAVVPLLAIVPLLADGASQGPSWQDIARTLGVLAAFVLAGHYLVRPAFQFVARAKASELLTAAALLLVLGSALVMDAAGMSMGLGAFLAGMLVAESEYRHQLEADIEPFRGLLLGLFFIAVGMSVDFGLLAREWPLVVAGVAGLMLIKFSLLLGLARLFGLPAAPAFQVALLLPQGGEFAFVLFSLAVATRVMDGETANLLIAVVMLSMLLTPFVVRLQRPLVRRLTPRPEIPDETIPDTGNPVIVAGFGRVGQIVGKVLATRGIGYTAVDPNPEQILLSAQHGYKIYYGDATRADLLHAAGADRARLIVVAVDDAKAAERVVETVRHHFPHLKIVARAHNRLDAVRLMDAGVDFVMRETFESSVKMGEQALVYLGLDAADSAAAAAAFREDDLAHLDSAVERLVQDPSADRREDRLQG